jgi:hypothetical protein
MAESSDWVGDRSSPSGLGPGLPESGGMRRACVAEPVWWPILRRRLTRKAGELGRPAVGTEPRSETDHSAMVARGRRTRVLGFG